MFSIDDNVERNLNDILIENELIGEVEATRGLDSEDIDPFMEIPDVDFAPRSISLEDEEEEESTRGIDLNDMSYQGFRSIKVKKYNKIRSKCTPSEDEYLKVVNQVKQQVQEIVNQKKAFKDADFPVSNPKKILFRYPNAPYVKSFKNVEQKIHAWKRLTKIISNPVVFKDGVDANDIRQGSIGSCWFLSSLSIVAIREERIKKCFVSHNTKLGVYGFVFFKNGRWHPVIIDGLFSLVFDYSLSFSF